jgi:dipeptidase D
MVCEKLPESDHDFLRDPLKLYVKDGWLAAEGTTLGADDGIAVAAMMAMLDGALASHPALECLFTTSEETGMNGTIAFDFSKVSARRMLNLDSASEAEVVCGCAGGVRSEITFKELKTEPTGDAICISLSGLCGGHSGEDINRGLANANRLMGRILLALQAEMPVCVAAIQGGSKDNAIPRDCTAVIVVENGEKAAEIINGEAKSIAAELATADSDFTCKVEKCALVPSWDAAPSARILAAICNAPCGVIEMSRDAEGLVEWSSNLGVIETEEEKITLSFLSRSTIEARIDHTIRMFDALALACGGAAEHHSRYTGWNYEKISPLREAYLDTFRALFGKEATPIIIHAGLECGLIRAKVPDMDMISIGPETVGLHSPSEKMNIASAERFWQILERMLG